MKKTKELDSYTAYFDDLWVYQLGIEQSCYIWAIDNIKEQPKHTPLEHGFRSSLAFNCFSKEIRITENRGASWIFREELDKREALKTHEFTKNKNLTHCFY